MNEVIIVDHPGDNFNDLLDQALELVKNKRTSYVMFEFNSIKLFVKKDSVRADIEVDYEKKLKALANS
ncbi:MAG: hypothetical protein HC836_39355 [Richelia sp. RM2_1_2]|nr:hypothetical protein [Richelia sp. RM2_1_2]